MDRLGPKSVKYVLKVLAVSILPNTLPVLSTKNLVEKGVYDVRRASFITFQVFLIFLEFRNNNVVKYFFPVKVIIFSVYSYNK